MALNDYEALLHSDVPLLELNDAVVRRGGRDILTVEHLKIMPGDQVVVLGPNGAGKSTFVKLLTREMVPLWREDPPVHFCGDPRPVVAMMRRILGVVSTTMQDQIIVHLSAHEIVLGGFFGALGVPDHQKKNVTDEMCEIAYERLRELSCDHLADRDICTLSTGQVRRVLFARAIVHNPKVVVFDEPCAGLDPEGVWHVRQSLSALAQAGHTVLLVTHLVEDIRPECNRVLLIKDGRLIADGTKAEILTTQNMRDLFGAPVTIEERGGHYHLW